MACFDVGVGRLAGAHTIDEVLLMRCVGKSTVHFVAHNRLADFRANINLPAGAHSPHNHHPVATVNLHAFGILWPVWIHIAVADSVIGLEHVRVLCVSSKVIMRSSNSNTDNCVSGVSAAPSRL